MKLRSGITVIAMAVVITVAACNGSSPQNTAKKDLSSGDRTETTAEAYPVTIKSCGMKTTYRKAPSRAVANDVNIVAVMLALGLEDSLVGISGVSDREALDHYGSAYKKVPVLSEKYFTKEVLLGANPDFVFAGYNYGFALPGADGVTPQDLQALDINSYSIIESCPDRSDPVGLEHTYEDLRNIGKIFGVSQQADDLIDGYRQRIEAVRQSIPSGAEPTRAFVYDSGTDSPLSAVANAIPTDIISRAGGRNIFADVSGSWETVNWETVVDRDPELIVIVDYGEVSADQKQQMLIDRPALARVTAVKNRRFVVLPYAALTPGPDNIGAVEAIAAALH